MVYDPQQSRIDQVLNSFSTESAITRWSLVSALGQAMSAFEWRTPQGEWLRRVDVGHPCRARCLGVYRGAPTQSPAVSADLASAGPVKMAASRDIASIRPERKTHHVQRQSGKFRNVY